MDDCVSAILLAGASEEVNGKVFNLGSTEVVGLKALAEMMINLGYGGAFEFIPFPLERKAIDIGDYYSDFALITKVLGWQPQVALRDGLLKTMAYYHSNYANYWQQ